MGVKPQISPWNPPLSRGPFLSRDPGVDTEAGVRLRVEPVHPEGHQEGRKQEGGDGGSAGTQSDTGHQACVQALSRLPAEERPGVGLEATVATVKQQTAKFKAQLFHFIIPVTCSKLKSQLFPVCAVGKRTVPVTVVRIRWVSVCQAQARANHTPLISIPPPSRGPSNPSICYCSEAQVNSFMRKLGGVLAHGGNDSVPSGAYSP